MYSTWAAILHHHHTDNTTCTDHVYAYRHMRDHYY